MPSQAESEAPISLHARHEHGGHPIQVIPGPGHPRFEVLWPDGPVAYPSARQLIRALYNGGDTNPATARDPGMTFNRYFRLDGPQDDMVGMTIFDLFLDDASAVSPEPPRGLAPKVLQPAPVVPRRSRSRRWCQGVTAGAAFSVLTLFGSSDALARPVDPSISIEAPIRAWADPVVSIVVEPTSPEVIKAKSTLTVDPKAIVRGIDLVNRAHEVRKLLFAGFGSRISRSGYEPDDVLQEVYKGILARNVGTCVFDPRKASFGHYVHMVCGCVLANYHRKQSRRAIHEQVGMYVPGEEGIGDAALAANDIAYGNSYSHGTEPEFLASESSAIHSFQEHVLLRGGDNPLVPLAVECVPLVYMGHTRSEIANIIGIEPSKVGRALAFVRSLAEGWGAQQGITRSASA